MADEERNRYRRTLSDQHLSTTVMVVVVFDGICTVKSKEVMRVKTLPPRGAISIFDRRSL